MPRPTAASASPDALTAALARSGVALTSREAPLCSLWAGYGRVTSADAARDDGSRVSVVIKRVQPPPAPASDVGHARKLASYKAEAEFYRSVASGKLVEDADAVCRVARPLAIVESDFSSSSSSYSLALALTDLRPDFPVFAKGGLRPPQLRAALAWLADFHAAHWGVAAREDVPALLKEREGEGGERERDVFGGGIDRGRDR